MFVVQGVKRITVWPRETFRPETHHLVGAGGKQVVHGLDRADAPEGLDLVGKPGDILYWPSSYWHVGTAVDPSAVTAAVNVGLFLEPGGASIAAEVVDAVLRDAGLRIGHRGLYAAGRSETSVPLPAREKGLLDLLATLVATGSLERLVHAQWMHRVSASGVTATPPLRTVPPELPIRVVRGGHGAVLWYVDGEHAFVSAGHGERFRGPATCCSFLTLSRLCSPATESISWTWSPAIRAPKRRHGGLLPPACSPSPTDRPVQVVALNHSTPSAERHRTFTSPCGRTLENSDGQRREVDHCGSVRISHSAR